jgi:peptide/nickel transport system substrate-binding protein
MPNRIERVGLPAQDDGLRGFRGGSMMFRKFIAASLLSLAASAAPAQAPATLVVPQTGDPRTLSPNFASDPQGFSPTSNIYSHLVAIDWGVNKGTTAYGDLADSWSTSADGHAVTFKLNPQARWHDGKPVTAADVKFTFDTIIRKKYPAFAVLKNVKDITAPDDHTVVLHLTDPETGFVPMLAQISNWTAKIYPKHLWEPIDGFDNGPYVNKPVGSGPFKFVRWDRGQPVELEANKEYFRGAPKVDRLLFRALPDVNVARAEFDAGRLVFLPYDYAPPLAEIPALQRDSGVRIVFTPSHFSRDIQLNLKRPPLDKLEVRQAIAHAIDREAMNKLAFNGYWIPAIHASVESQGDLINRNAKFPAHDKERAERLLDQAGFARSARGWRFNLSVTNPDFVDCRSMMEVLVQQLRAVGIDAQHERFDQATWFRRQFTEKNFDISCYFTRYGPDPDAFREHFATGGGRNFMGYSDAELDTISQRAATMRDGAERRAIYHRIQEIVVRDLPYINLFNEVKTTMIKSNWRGFTTEPEAFDKSITWFGYYAVRPPGR